jgi:NTE family protein
MKIGIALSGGGARGIAHLGVIKALEEFGLKFSVLSGTSAGSIVGSLYAYGFKPEEILNIIQKISVFKSVKPAWTWMGLLSLDGLKDVLLKHMPENNFSALKLPLTIAATDIKKGEIVYFNEGELIPCIMASCCVPAVFAPVNFQDKVLVDGGVLDNLPVGPIRQKCDFLIGSHCNPIGVDFDAKNLRTIIERSLLMAINGNTIKSRESCDIFIEPPGLHKYSGFELTKAQEIFDAGYRFTLSNFTFDDFKSKSSVR